MSINKTTKGALGLGAAAVLLAGGAGSLAYWSGGTTMEGGSITSGTLSLSNSTCDANWKYAATKAGAGTTVVKYVPGDIITKNCTFTITASGDNLSATLNTPAVSFPAAAAGSSRALTPTAAYKIGTADAVVGNNTITSADNAKTVTAAITVTIPFGTTESGSPKVNTNDTQNLTSTLNTITVTATQITPNA